MLHQFDRHEMKAGPQARFEDRLGVAGVVLVALEERLDVLVRDLLARTRDFTAIFCSNDIAAIGAVRAICDAGLRCPEDISVIGFDDIASAAYMCPRLTTVRQPLRRMGEMAVQTLLKRIESPNEAYPESIMFEPELMVRESTGAAPHHEEAAAAVIEAAEAPVKVAKIAKTRPVKTSAKK